MTTSPWGTGCLREKSKESTNIELDYDGKKEEEDSDREKRRNDKEQKDKEKNISGKNIWEANVSTYWNKATKWLKEFMKITIFVLGDTYKVAKIDYSQ